MAARSRWRLLALWVGVVLPALATGCKSSAPEAPPETHVLRFWHTFNADEALVVDALVSAFEAEHPGVRVEVSVLSFGAGRHRLRAALDGASGPDLARAEIAWLPELAEGALIHDLSKAVTLDAHIPQVRPLFEWSKRVWAYPQGVDCLALYYNAEHFEAAWLLPPKTWSELEHAARRLTIDDGGRHLGQPGFKVGAAVRHGLYLKSDGYYFLPFLWGLGGETLSPITGAVHIGDTVAIVAADYYQRLGLREGVTPVRPDYSNEYQDELDRFGAGRVSMILNGPWAARDILRGDAFEIPENLGVVPVPKGAGGMGGSPTGGHGYVVSRKTQHADLARALGAFLTSPAAQKRLALSNHIPPTLSEVYKDPEIRSNRLLMAFKGALDEAHGRAVFLGMAQIFDALTPALRRLLRDEGAASELMPAVSREWQGILGSGD